jgi:TM2 domain-containing membrane protein YozV
MKNNAAAPGWYPIPGGGQRFWNGIEWTAGVLGAPDARAEYGAPAPDRPPPDTLVPMPASDTLVYQPRELAPAVSPGQPAGWYPGPSGMVQWWDGRAWGPFAPQPAQPMKEVGIAYLFFLLLGGVGAYRFYLGRAGSAVLLLCLWMGGWLLAALLIGIPMIIAGGIWLLVDLFILPSMVREENARRLARR